MPCRAKTRCSVEVATVTPASPNSRRSSSRMVWRRALGSAGSLSRSAATACPALRLGGAGARAAALAAPPDHRCGRHTEPHCRSPATHPPVNRSQRSRRNIHRQRLGHPAGTGNQISASVSIPLPLRSAGKRPTGPNYGPDRIGMPAPSSRDLLSAFIAQPGAMRACQSVPA